jgi:predicted RNA-binding protein YlxR (DUF448 family)
LVVRPTTASDAALGPGPVSPGPVRTCIGCRQRAAASELLRVVVASCMTGTDAGSTDVDTAPVRVVPDPRRRAPGRGASLHRDLGCVALAERRRSFARALRVSGPFDLTAVREYVSGGSDRITASGGNPRPGTRREQ